MEIADFWAMFNKAFMIMTLRTISILFFCAFVYILLHKVGERLSKKDGKKKPYETHQKRLIDWKEAPSRSEALGQRGEDAIADILIQTVQGEFELFRNVYVPHGDTTSEIDLLMVHEKGIFVFESKNYSGLIFGSMEQTYWTKVLGKEKYSFYNPVSQNRTHINALMQYLQLAGDNFYSCIVFSNQCALKKVPNNSSFTIITQVSELESALNRLFSKSAIHYGKEEIQRISERLLPLTNVDSSVKEKHIADIRAAWESDVCPFCGGKLVRRRGKYGEFFGCSRYPQCKFKRNIQR